MCIFGKKKILKPVMETFTLKSEMKELNKRKYKEKDNEQKWVKLKTDA